MNIENIHCKVKQLKDFYVYKYVHNKALQYSFL